MLRLNLTVIAALDERQVAMTGQHLEISGRIEDPAVLERLRQSALPFERDLNDTILRLLANPGLVRSH